MLPRPQLLPLLSSMRGLGIEYEAALFWRQPCPQPQTQHLLPARDRALCLSVFILGVSLAYESLSCGLKAV